MEHSYTEVSACGRRTDYMTYFAYIAGWVLLEVLLCSGCQERMTC